MANRRFQDVQALNREVKLIAGRVSVGGSGAPTLADGLGIASVTVAATGKYTITLDDKYTGLLYYGATYCQLAGADQLFAIVEAHSVTVNKTVEIHFFDNDGNAEAPADGDEFSFFLMLRNSSVE